MNNLLRALVALVVALTPLSAVTPAQAVEEPCSYYGTIFAGSPYARDFGTVCGRANIDAIWPTVEAHLNQYSAPATQWFMNQAAEEAARLAAEEVARVAAEAAADAANCVGAVTSFAGDARYEISFPAICTAAGIAARATAIQNYFDLVTAERMAAQNSAPIIPVPPTSPGGYINNPGIGIDCGTPEGMMSAWCINQQQGYNPNTGVWGTPPINPIDTFNCVLPQNAVLPICGNQGPLTFPDGSINCANPVNAPLASCTNIFNAGVNGALDCTRSELRTLPACINGTAVGGPNFPIPPTFGENTQPLTFPDGTINCANPVNAPFAFCTNIFNAGVNGALDCTRSELRTLPACINGTAVGGPNVPIPPTNISTPSTTFPTTTPNTSTPTVNPPAVTTGAVTQSTPSNKSAPIPTQVASEKITKNKEELFPDADGEEEAPEATLTVTYSKSLARYIVQVDSNLAEESLVLRGVKKGAKSLKFTLTTDEDGVAGVRTKTKLSGFTLTVYFGADKLDSVKVS